MSLGVSVVVPVYNVEKYLERCLDSVLAQTFLDFEIVCIDDGSTDGSRVILEKYRKIDSRVKVFSQPNSGLGVARNHGVRVSTKPYLFFLDSDDWISANCLDELYKKATQTESDLCIYGLSKYDEKNGKYISDSYYDTSCYRSRGLDVCTYIELKDVIFRRFGAAFKLYRKSFFVENNLFFEEKVYYEDVVTHVKAFILAKKMAFVDKELYFYRINRIGSIMTDINEPKKVTDVFVYLREVEDFLKKQGKYEELKKQYIEFVLEQLTFHYRRQTFLKDLFIEEAQNYLLSYPREMIAASSEVALGFYDKYFNKKKISLIVPVYNASKYLAQCLESLLQQTLNDIEIICIDDGSTDNSYQILLDYAKKDSRISVLHQKNQKQGAARNNAMKVANGKYVQFVDADDYLAKNACEVLYLRMEKYQLDMLSFGGTNFKNETGMLESNPYYEFRYLPSTWEKPCFNYLDCIDFVQKMAVSAALTMYKMSFLQKHQIKFPERLFFEDNVFFAEAIFSAERVGIEKSTLYYRRIHGESTTQNWDVNFKDYLEIARRVLVVVEAKKVPKVLVDVYKEMYLSSCVRIYNRFDEKYRAKYQGILLDLLNEFSFTQLKLNVPSSKHKRWNLWVWKNDQTGQLLKILGFVLYEKLVSPKNRRLVILGLPVYSKKEKINSVTIRYLFFKYKRLWNQRDKV